MKNVTKIIGFIMGSYVFWIIAYIIALIVFSFTNSKVILAGACGIMLFFVLASGVSYESADDKEKNAIFQFIQWIAIVSIFFMSQHFLHIFDHFAD